MKILEKMIFEFSSIKWNVILVDETIVMENQIIELLLNTFENEFEFKNIEFDDK